MKEENSEDNIIKFDFGNHAKESQAIADEEILEKENVMIEHDFRSISNGRALSDTLRKISGLNPSVNSIVQADAIVREYSHDEVKKWLEAATDMDINKRPGFYVALAKKYRRVDYF